MPFQYLDRFSFLPLVKLCCYFFDAATIFSLIHRRVLFIADAYQQNISAVVLQGSGIIPVFDLLDGGFRGVVPFQFDHQRRHIGFFLRKIDDIRIAFSCR